ncbi:hypothetical protein DENSPDRAFT_114017 [Dentipellis sp. KUC8613]|nr:hypothetical protein DENSPDRAFT_114017 [Dentipellis sp. KUC8613]
MRYHNRSISVILLAIFHPHPRTLGTQRDFSGYPASAAIRSSTIDSHGLFPQSTALLSMILTSTPISQDEFERHPLPLRMSFILRRSHLFCCCLRLRYCLRLFCSHLGLWFVALIIKDDSFSPASLFG